MRRPRAPPRCRPGLPLRLPRVPQEGAQKGAAAAADGKPKGNAKDRIELDTTQITGNRELPKVLYIVPWKHSDLSDLAGRPANSLLDEVLTPVDRDVFQRENRYYRALQPDEPRPGGPRPRERPSSNACLPPQAADAPRARGMRSRSQFFAHVSFSFVGLD